MFSELDFSHKRWQFWVRGTSFVVHGLLLAWLLHAPEPQLLTASSVALGENGKSVTRLYWSSKHPDDSTHSSPDSATQHYRHQRLGEKLTWKQPAESAKLTLQQSPVTRAEQVDQSKSQTLSALGHGAQAGQFYGTLSHGSTMGDEIRPALPISTADPVVYPWQLPNIEGNEVIEITIDERGAIVQTNVLVSLSPEIDSKCLAALESWHFHPATKNGRPISSKQDAIFPFHARG